MSVETLQPAGLVPYGQLIPVAVHFDDLDPLGMLHNSRYPLLAERAWAEFWRRNGYPFDGDWTAPSDTYAVAKELKVSYRRPIAVPGDYAVHLWIERLARVSLVYGFRVCAADGTETYAQGHRSIVRIDPQTLRPTSWSDSARAIAQGLLRPAEDTEPKAAGPS
ncbi:acyl-CoA thioesterase [Streptomyces sp. NPDC002067]